MRRKTLYGIVVIVLLALTGCTAAPPNLPDSEDPVKKVDLIPMVMINDRIYLDTGRESEAELRCGTMDGTITSEVDRSEKPKQNNQSNFGIGYGYQTTGSEDTIEIEIEGKWFVFAAETMAD